MNLKRWIWKDEYGKIKVENAKMRDVIRRKYKIKYFIK